VTGDTVVTPLLLGMGWFPDQVGGLNRYFRELACALAAKGIAVSPVVVGPVTDPLLDVVGAGAHGSPLPSRLWRFAQAAGRSGHGADVVDAHFALYALVPAVLGKVRNLPMVLHFQGPWADESVSSGERPWLAGIKRRVERIVYRRARQAVVLSAAFKRILVERYGVAPWIVSVIPPGVDLDHFRPASKHGARVNLGVPDEAWVALAVRRLVPRMGLNVLLEAWARLAGDGQDRLLLIAGHGPARGDLEALARRLGVASTVRFLGAVDEATLLSCYRAADTCIVPSTALEGFGLVVLESLACGTPVVATDVGGLPDSLAALDPTLIVPAGDVAALAGRLLAAIDGTRPLPAAARCRSHAERFSWETVVARTIEVYGRAIEGSHTHRRIRVVYLDHCAELSGGELALCRLLPVLEDVEAHVVLAQDGPLVSRLLRNGASVEVLPMADRTLHLDRNKVSPGKLPLRAALDSVVHVARLVRRLRELRPDLIHTNSLKAAVYGGIAGRLAGVPVVWHIRDRIADDYLPGPAVRLIRALARRLPHATIVNSASTLATLPDFLPAQLAVVSDAAWPRGHAAVIHSPVPTHHLLSLRNTNGLLPLRVGMVGRIAPWKGQHVFLEAFARAFPDGPTCGVIVGAPLFGEEDYEQEMKELVVRLGLAGRIEFCGFVEDVAGQLANLDVLVHASVIPEPFGQVVVEGMVAGLSVVAADAGGPAEVIRHGATGMLYPPGDVEALAGVLTQLAGDPELRRRLGEAGRAKGREFSPEAIAHQVMGVYRGVLGGARGEGSWDPHALRVQ